MEKVEADENPGKPLLQAMQAQLGQQNSTGTAKPNNTKLSACVMPQLNINKTIPAEEGAVYETKQNMDAIYSRFIIPPLNVPNQNSNGLLSQLPSSSGLSGGFTIPKLRTASGQPLEEPKLNTPLLNQWRSQNYSLEHNPQVKQDQEKCETMSVDACDDTTQAGFDTQKAIAQVIDLTSAVIISDKNRPPRETATAAARLKQKQNKQLFKIPFIPADNRLARLTNEIRVKHRLNADDVEFGKSTKLCTKHTGASATGTMLVKVMPLKPFLKYAATSHELRNLKMYKSLNYGNNIKRFMFDTLSPDQLVKESLKKSYRITRT